MKKRTLSIIPIMALLLFGITFNASAQNNRSINFGHENDGFQIIEHTKGNIRLNFSISKLDLHSFDYKDEEMHNIGVEGIVLPNQKGLPNVPTFSRMIAIPQGSEAVINIVSYEQELIKDVNIAPSRGTEPQGVAPQLDYIKDDKIYSKDAFYPNEFAMIGEQTSIRGVDVAILSISPVQFNPVTKEAIVYHNIEISIDYKGGNGQFGNNDYRSQYFDPILAQNIINYKDLPAIDYEARFQRWIKDDANGYEYIIVTPNNDAWAPYAQQLADLRIKQGITTKVFRLDEMGVNNTNEIKAWFHDAYNNWEIKPVAVCLLADHNTDMTQGIPAEVVPHPYEDICISDNKYADVDGNLLPDMAFSRLIAQNESELPVFVGKQIEYEVENPNMDAHSYQHPVTALGWQTARWFQLCSEVAGGYFRSIGKEPVRINQIYEGQPGSIWSSADNTNMVVDYFGPNGLRYIPASPAEMDDWNSGSPQQIVNAINDGTFIVQHRDHGLETGWGEPAFRNNHINQLTNVGKLTFVMSINCLTGKYNHSSDCFAEKFMRHTYNGQNAGAVAMLCPTEVSYSFVNDAYVWGVYDQFDPNFMPTYGENTYYEGNWLPTFGNVAGKYFLYQCSWPYNYYDKDITYDMFTAHCDAFLRIYTEVPQEMDVTHQDVQLAGLNTFTITAPKNTTIALSTFNGEEYEIIAVTEGTGSTQNIEIPIQTPPTVINVVVTGQNYLRYEAEVEVIPADGPYLIVDSYELNDDNDQLDFGETTSFSMTFKNIGNDNSSNATATLISESEYITINKPTVSLEGIAPDATFNIKDAFEITVSDNVPNNTKNSLVVNIECDGKIYQNYLNIRAYAPELKIENVSITELAGNGNGQLDPAEQVRFSFTVKNNGRSDSNAIIPSLEVSNNFLEILNIAEPIECLAASKSITFDFDVYVNANTPIGLLVSYTLTCESGFYTTEKTFTSKVGINIEDFESGDLSLYDLDNSSPNPWIIENFNSYEGLYCIKSGDINDNQSTEITLTYEVSSNDSISFYYKVSSEKDWDKLIFYIDNLEKGAWSGEEAWTQATFSVEEGTHTFKWKYLKDSSMSNGEDCAWVDYIILPANNRMAISAGLDIETCDNFDIEINGYANNHASLAWTSSGDGTFDDATITNPIYTPGTQDADNGYVTLTLTGTDEDGETISDETVINFLGTPSVIMAESATVCFNESYTTEVEIDDFLSVEWTSNGDGSFFTPNSINTTYTPGNQDIENGEVILTISVEGCENIEKSITLSIRGEVNIEAPEIISSCHDEDAYILVDVENADMITWTTSGDGTFSNDNANETYYTPGNQDIANGGTTLTITAEGCSSQSKDISLMLKEAISLINYSTDNNACINSIADVLVEFSGTAPFIVKLEDDNTEYQILEDNILHINAGTESKSYTITDVTDAEGCHNSLSESFFINVHDIQAPEKPIGETIIAKDKNPSSSYHVTANDNILSYEWSLEPNEAGTINGNDNEIVITWNQDYNGDASLKVKAISNECETNFSEALNIFSSMINVDEISSMSLNIYPNPVDETINIKIDNIKDNKVKILIYNILGENVYSQELTTSNNNIDTQINVENLNSGSYLLTIISNDNVWKQQIIVK